MGKLKKFLVGLLQYVFSTVSNFVTKGYCDITVILLLQQDNRYLLADI